MTFKNRFLGLCATALFVFGAQSHAAVSIGHVENTSVGGFQTSTGAALTTGGVSIGYFTGAAPADSAFGTSITDFASLITAGYVDVRNLASTTQTGGFDWSFPLNLGGTVQNVSFTSVPLNTQLYIIAFNAGSYVAGTQGSPATTSSSFAGFSEWAVIKDTADHRSPADLGTKNLLLNTVAGADVLIGTDSGNNVNLMAVPEPTKSLLSLGAIALLGFRRRR